jgi:hypothetical protein
MAKAPRSGAVKTRLVPPRRAGQAAILSGCFLEDIRDTFNAIAALVPAEGCVAYWPPAAEAEFHDLLPSIGR